MPGLSLTLAQGARLFGVAPDACARMFSELVEEGILCRLTNYGRYGRPNGELQLVTPQQGSGFLDDARPKDGDVLIAGEPGHKSGYTLSVMPGLPQTLYRSYQEALAVARRFARRYGVSALWATHNGTTLTTVSLRESSQGIRRIVDNSTKAMTFLSSSVALGEIFCWI